MRARLWALTATAGMTTAVLSAFGVGTAASADADPSMALAGSSWMYPAFHPEVTRYAVHRDTDGTVHVDVSDASAVWFDGMPDPDGSATFDVHPGDEISVFVDDSAGHRRTYALYVLPDRFPKLSATRAGAPLAPGNIALTLDRHDGSTSPTRFEAIVDRHGVPVHTRQNTEGRSLDFKVARSGELTMHRPTTTPLRTGGALVVLDDQLREVRRIETTGLVDTDDHDSILESDGSRWLVAYEPNPETGLVDSIIQHVTPEGVVDFEWSSAPYADETVTPQSADYAHVNSIHVEPNGDVLASFRHLSSVFLIASQAHGGHRRGDVIWKLGGRESDFTFPTGDVGPCAQHTASILPNGNVLMFDNGSSTYTGSMCVDPEAPDGAPVQRPSSRVVEFALSGTTATPVRTYGPAGRFAFFMGSAARVAHGNVLIGWSADQTAMASETDSSGSTIWSLADERLPEGGQRPKAYISYRAALVPERDGFDPEVTLDGPADGATVAQGSEVPVTFSCADRGGSTLRSCEGPVERRLDTSAPGAHTWQVVARDGSGRQTISSRTYTVTAVPSPTTPPAAAPVPAPTTAPPTPAAVPRPDLAVRPKRGSWVGAGRHLPTRQIAVVDLPRGQAPLGLTVRLTNSGSAPGRFWLHAPAAVGDGAVGVRYVFRGADRTRALSRGWRTPRLAPGESLRVRLTATARGVLASRTGLRLRAGGRGPDDSIRLLLRPTRM